MGRPIETKHDFQIEALYLAGYSTRFVADQVGLSGSRVGVIVKRLGISRSRCVASKPGVYHKPDSTHWRTCRFRARSIWQREVGQIPKGFHVHHMDKDYTNNNLSNLILVSPAAHGKMHANPVPRHLRPERQAYMKIYLKEYRKKQKDGTL